MKYIPYHQILMRVPQFPLDAEIYEYWEPLKDAIAYSSPDFYKLISDLSWEEFCGQPVRIQNTVRRYFNRSKYRAVPFGMFAGTCIINMEHVSSNNIGITSWQQVHVLPDWSLLFEKMHYSFDDLQKENASLIANGTYYQFGGIIRYICGKNGKFELAEIDSSDHVLNLLKACSTPISIIELQNAVAGLFEDDKSFLDLVAVLIEEQLIQTSLDPNIIGVDYFQRRKFVQVSSEEKRFLNVVRPLLSGKLPEKNIDELNSYLDYLVHLELPQPELKDLEEFKQNYKKRFDRETVPLLTALDPELGVGYGNVEHADGEEALVHSFLPGKSSTSGKERTLRSFLEDNICCNISDVINLERFIPAWDAPIAAKSFPNSLSCVFTLSDDLIIIDKIGGCSANQLLGRFSVLGDGFEQICKDIAALESTANPDVIFFDIAYTAESDVDNVNRRSEIYDYELRILNYPGSERTIALNDVFITISGSEIVLRSKKLGKRLIPRMASAYNYQRSQLAVFKFICDLMYYGLQSDLNIELPGMFPGKNFYPRVQYRNIVASPATWVLSREELPLISQDLSGFIQLIKMRGITGHIRFGNGDQTLCLDTCKYQDMETLFTNFKKFDSLVLWEAFIPQKSIVCDTANKPYHAQFVMPFVHKERVYYGSGKISEQPPIQHTFFPGDRWLSLEIFTHPRNMDAIVSKLTDLVRRRYSIHLNNWFFVRYNEGGEHLRLRFEFDQKFAVGAVMCSISDTLAPETTAGIISEVSVRPYKREMDRYSIAGIDKIESLFSFDSDMVLEIIKEGFDDVSRYNHAVRLFCKILESGLWEWDDYFKWISNVSEQFNKECSVSSEGFKKINGLLREGLPGSSSTQGVLRTMVDTFCQAILDIMTDVPQKRRLPLLTDIFHMHINRLFPQYQRTHEMIIYNLLIALVKKHRAISKSGNTTVSE